MLKSFESDYIPLWLAAHPFMMLASAGIAGVSLRGCVGQAFSQLIIT
jgi:hypothetical protein